MGVPGVAATQVVTPVTFLALPLLFLSCSVNSSLISSGSVFSPIMSQSGSVGSCLGRDTPADLSPVAELLEERLGSESDWSESQSLSPATEPQPSTDSSTGPDPELSESDSLEENDRQNLSKILYYSTSGADVSKIKGHDRPKSNFLRYYITVRYWRLKIILIRKLIPII